MKFFLLLFLLVINLSHASAKPNFLGQQCEGDEFTPAKMGGKWAVYKCSLDEWLIEIEGYNPFFGKLDVSKEKRSEVYNYYNIVPTIPVGPQIRWILRQHRVQVSPNGEIMVVRK